MAEFTAAEFSYTRLETFKNCPRQYAYRYIEKPPVEKRASIEAHLGTVCHVTVQQIYLDLNLSKRMTLEETLSLYDRMWEEEKSAAMSIIKDRYTEDNYRETGKRFVKQFYESEAPFADGHTLAIEKEVHVTLSGGERLVGYIDRLVDHGGGRYEIIDYKTNKNLPSLQELQENWQLPLYQIGLLQMYPDMREITCTWHFLAHNKKMTVSKSRDDLGRLEESVRQLIAEIGEARVFEPHASALCSWCDFEPICPARKHLYQTALLEPEELSQDEGVRLVDEYLRLKSEAAEMDRRVGEIEEKIFAYAKQQDILFVRGTHEKLRIWSKQGATRFLSQKEDPGAGRAIEEILRRHGLWERFASVSTFVLGKAAENKEIPAQVLAELKPFTKTEDVWRLYPSKL